jgi:multicomponent Na+:H+ antiporter subunit E
VTRLAAPALTRRGTVVRAGATAAIAVGFYLALGDPTDPFDVATGLVSGVLVAAVLGRVTFERSPTLATLGSFARAVGFLPRLLAAVVRANLSLAAVVLDPRLPIDPQVVRIPAPEGPVGRALLANSITLTPGTLTLDVTGDELVIHTLTVGSRADLESGSLQRAVASVVGEAPADGSGVDMKTEAVGSVAAADVDAERGAS